MKRGYKFGGNREIKTARKAVFRALSELSQGADEDTYFSAPLIASGCSADENSYGAAITHADVHYLLEPYVKRKLARSSTIKTNKSPWSRKPHDFIGYRTDCWKREKDA